MSHGWGHCLSLHPILCFNLTMCMLELTFLFKSTRRMLEIPSYSNALDEKNYRIEQRNLFGFDDHMVHNFVVKFCP